MIYIQKNNKRYLIEDLNSITQIYNIIKDNKDYIIICELTPLTRIEIMAKKSSFKIYLKCIQSLLIYLNKSKAYIGDLVFYKENKYKPKLILTNKDADLINKSGNYSEPIYKHLKNPMIKRYSNYRSICSLNIKNYPCPYIVFLYINLPFYKK